MRILFIFIVLISLPIQAAAVYENVAECCCQTESEKPCCSKDRLSEDCCCDCENCPCKQQQRAGHPLHLWEAILLKFHGTVNLLSYLESPSWNLRNDSPPSPPPQSR